MTYKPDLTAGVHIPWKYVAGLFMRIHSFIPLTEIVGDKAEPSILGTFGLIQAKLPNPEAEPNNESLRYPSNIKATSNLYLGPLVIRVLKMAQMS
jgi:hypothetical protein